MLPGNSNLGPFCRQSNARASDSGFNSNNISTFPGNSVETPTDREGSKDRIIRCPSVHSDERNARYNLLSGLSLDLLLPTLTRRCGGGHSDVGLN